MPYSCELRRCGQLVDAWPSAPQRRHARAIGNRTIRKIPISPRRKAGEIGLQIVATEDVRGEREVAQEEQPPGNGQTSKRLDQCWHALRLLGSGRAARVEDDLVVLPQFLDDAASPVDSVRA